MSLRPLFVSQVYEASLAAGRGWSDFNAQLIDVIRMMAEEDEAERPFVYLQPQAGTVLMWESWLRHEVPTNLAKADRISISFNYA